MRRLRRFIQKIQTRRFLIRVCIEVLTVGFSLIGLVSFVMLLGTIGSVETFSMELEVGEKRMIIFTAAFVLSVLVCMGLDKLSKRIEEDI